MAEKKNNNLLIYGCLGIVMLGSTFFVILGGAVAISALALTMGGGSTTLSTNSGDLANVTDIPDVLKPIFVAAGQKFEVSPAFVAAIFWKEHGEGWQTEGPWASSPVGANGPFQFMEKTWEGWSAPNNSNGKYETEPKTIAKYGGYGQDGDGDGKADVQNLLDSAFAAAKLLGANGAAPNTTDLNKLRNAASLYNSGRSWDEGKGIPETADYVPAVISAYQKFLKQM